MWFIEAPTIGRCAVRGAAQIGRRPTGAETLADDQKLARRELNFPIRIANRFPMREDFERGGSYVHVALRSLAVQFRISVFALRRATPFKALFPLGEGFGDLASRRACVIAT
jgi:hypothetical protein